MRGTIEGDGALGVDEEWDEAAEADDRAATRRRHRRAEHGVIAALVVVVLAAVAVIGFTSGDDDGDGGGPAERTTTSAPADPTTTAPTPTTPTTAPTGEADGDAGAGAGGGPAAPAAPTDPEPAPPTTDLEDGRHAVHLTGIDAPGGTLEVDVVQYLTDEAADEYVEDHPDEYPGMYEEEGGYPYDALVVNENPRLRTLTVSPDAQVVVIQRDDSTYAPHTIAFAELPAYLAPQQEVLEPGDDRISYSVFWLTIHDGEIVAMEEQFQA